MKAMYAAQLTSLVDAAEVAEWLPDAGCRPVHDLNVTQMGLGQTLSTFLASAAVNLGKPGAALQYHRYWLEISLHPLKDCHAHAHLVSAMPTVQVEGDIEGGV